VLRLTLYDRAVSASVSPSSSRRRIASRRWKIAALAGAEFRYFELRLRYQKLVGLI
jgi:hypothetical protein